MIALRASECSTHSELPALFLPSCAYMINAESLITFSTVAKIVATPYLTTAVSILLVSVDNSHMNIYNSLKTQRNSRITP